MDLQLIPVDGMTGERINLNPSVLKDMDNITLTEFYSQLKVMADLYKKADTEVKKRLDEGQEFKRLSYGKAAQQKVLTMTNKQKYDLVKAHGWDCVEPITLTKLKSKFGYGIEQELEQSIVYKDKKAPLKWDA